MRPDPVLPTASASCRAAAVADIMGDVQPTVRAISAQDSPTGRPYLAVTVGTILVYVHDQAALEAISAAWAAAMYQGQRLWPARVTVEQRARLHALHGIDVERVAPERAAI